MFNMSLLNVLGKRRKSKKYYKDIKILFNRTTWINVLSYFPNLQPTITDPVQQGMLSKPQTIMIVVLNNEINHVHN